MRPVLLALSLAACAHQGPVDVVGAYLEAEQQGRYPAAWRLLHADDQAARPLDAWTQEHVDAGPVWLACARRASFRVTAEHVDGPRADLVVATTMPSVADAARRFHPSPGATGPELMALAEDVLIGTDVPSTTKDFRYALRQEGGTWRVWLGLREQDAAVARAVEAAQARQGGDLEAERAALIALIAVPADGTGAVEALQADARARLTELGTP